MRWSSFWAITVVGCGVAVAAPAFSSAGQDGRIGSWPFDPTLPLNAIHPGGQIGPGAHNNPGVTTPLVEPPKTRKDTGEPSRPPSQSEQLDDLFGRLAKATDAQEASSIALAIQTVWLRSGSDTADLLMVRAVTAVGEGKQGLATDLLDKIILIDPDWAEAWNKRATLRFLANDDVGAMADIAHVLALEPRHFGALSGMSFILHRHGMKKDALAMLRRTGAIYPHNPELEKMIDELSQDVEGRDI